MLHKSPNTSELLVTMSSTIVSTLRTTQRTMEIAMLKSSRVQNEALKTARVSGQKRSLSQSVGHLIYLEQSPAEFVHEVFQENGFDPATKNSPNTFLKPTEKMIADYKLELLQVFRENDVDKLRQLHQEGQSLQCCNRFGESLIHMACRRGWTDNVKFLVNEAGVSLMVQDDYGRTPLHDACWTAEPNFELVGFLIEQVPELLLIKDVRGHTPFNYVRKEHWPVWRQFLEEQKDKLRPSKMLKITTE